jgi:alcohol dehydrogenase
MPNPFANILAEKAIELISGNLRQAYINGADIEARANMLLASSMALMAASASAGLGLVHALTHAIGGHYDLPHGLVIAACLPFVLSYNAGTVPGKYSRAARLMGVDATGLSEIEAAERLSAAVRDLIADVGIKGDLRSIGVKASDIPRLAELSMNDGSTPVNPRTIDYEDFLSLYRSILDAEGTDE